MLQLLTTQQNEFTTWLPSKSTLSNFFIGLIGYLLLMFTCNAQTVTFTGNIPYAKKLIKTDGSLDVWTMSEIRNDKDETIAPIEGSVMVKDMNSLGQKLGARSYIPKEHKSYKGTLDLTNTVLPATIAILVDDEATLTVTEIDDNGTAIGTAIPYKVEGTALWNPKSYKEFPNPLPPRRKYQLELSYYNNANLTEKYNGGVDVDGVSVYIALLPMDVAVAVDANRDGQISFDSHDETTADKPYRFWINDDRDIGHSVDFTLTGDADWEQDDVESLGSDSLYSGLEYSRDLEDLTRVWINFSGVTKALDLSDISYYLTVRLKATSGKPRINFFQPVEPDGGRQYLKNQDVGYSQLQGQYGQQLCNVYSTQDVLVPRRAWENLPEDKVVHLLFEGAEMGEAE